MSHIRTRYENFAFDRDQYEVVEAALERALELAQAMTSLSRTPSKSSLLSWICVDFLASNDFRLPEDVYARGAYLHKIEVMTGKKVVMYDPVTRKVEYGYEALMEMAGSD